MKLEFAKLHGLGNDFVFIDDLSRDVELTPDQVAHLCDRHFGIGADGIILVRPSDDPACAAYMHYINSDGTLAEMCGNGVRCFAKYLVDRGFVSASDESFVADTLAGPRPITFTVDEWGKLSLATVDMGAPRLQPDRIPSTLPPTSAAPDATPFICEAPLESPWGTFAFTCVSMGNPHAVCFIDDFSSLPQNAFTDPANRSLDTFKLDEIGAYFEKHEVFPEKANIEFAHLDAKGIRMRVFERGCGETLACGTGACATSVAAHLTNRAGRENDVLLNGGILHIQWNEQGRVLMTGPAEESFTGSVHIS